MSPPVPEGSTFDRLLEMPEPERARILERAAVEDPDLVEQWHAFIRRLRQPPSTVRIDPPCRSPAALVDALEAGLAAAKSETAGARVGPYKLLQKIGEGGFGSVWMAEQQEPIHRRVALKIIKLGMDTREVNARFEAERQALALMDHPNIARVLDAGATESGRPYFVMELVRGVPITRYCDDNRVSAEARLRLFITVCQGVQHAHQKGVIHRDLKPSNILVTLHDGAPVPKIIDFGIAKATGGARLTEKTLFTQFHAFIGTPAYTSPEQMEMSGLDIDTRSDVYSLGVLLYELLAGRPPFDADELARSGLDAMRRTIREVDPPRPSTKLDTLTNEERTTVARQRGTDSRRLSLLLRGDLDCIVMRCLEKDRTRRYESVNGVAADIERHLQTEPIAARPPSRVYRAHKFVRRHKLGVVGAAAVALSLCAGLIASSILLVRERTARARAVESEQAEADLRRQAEEARVVETIRTSRTARDLAERLFAEGRLADGLAWLVHAARKNPRDPTIAPRLASVLATHNFFLPVGPAFKFASRVSNLQYAEAGRKVVVCCEDGTIGIIDFNTGGHTRTRISGGLHPSGVVFMGNPIIVRGNDDVLRVVDRMTGQIAREFAFGQKLEAVAVANETTPVVLAILEDRSIVVAEAITGRTRVMDFRHVAGTAIWLSPDGRWLARPGSNPGEGEIRDLATGETRGRGRASGMVRGVFFSPDSARLLVVTQVAPRRSEYQLFSVPDLQPLIAPGELNEPEYHGNAFLVGGFSADSRWFCIASQNGNQIFETASGSRIGPFVKVGLLASALRTERETVAAALGTGATFFTAPPIVRIADRWCSVTASPIDARVELTVRDVTTGDPIYAPLRHTGGVAGAAVSADGNTVFAVGMDGCAIVWNLRTGRRLAEPVVLESGLDCAVSMTSDGREMVIGRADGTVQRMRAGGEPARPLVLPRVGAPMPAPFVPDGPARLFFVGTDRTDVLDVATGRANAGSFSHLESIWGIGANTGMASGIAVRPDLRFMVVRTLSGVWQVWELNGGGIQRAVPLQGAPEGLAWAEFSPRGNRVALISLRHPESAKIWNLHTGQPVGHVLTQASMIPMRNVRGACFSPDGRLFAGGATDGNVTIWETDTGRRLRTIASNRSAIVTRLEFSADGACLAASNSSGQTRVWETASGRLLAEIPRATTSTFSPNGDRLLVRTGDTARVCDPRTGAEVGEAMTHSGVGIRSAEFSPDGRRVVTGAQDSTARIWDASTGLPISEPLVHDSRVTGCEFSPDGRFVRTEDAGRGGGSTFRVWSVPPAPAEAPAPDWLLQLATICGAKRIRDDGQCVDAPEAAAQIDEVRRTLAALPIDAPFAEWGRWILDDRADRPIAPGFSITSVEAERLEQVMLAGSGLADPADPR